PMPQGVDLSFAFGLKPEKAVDYFRGKGYAISWDWYDTWQEANSKAFTVAKVTRLDILRDIRSSVDKITAQGITFDQFRRELEPTLKAKGWWGRQKVIGDDGKVTEVQLGSPRRLNTIFRTNAQTALSAGRWKEFEANA